MSRYRAFKLPHSHQWGVVDRNIRRYLVGITAEDEGVADALARLLNREWRKWQDAAPPVLVASEAPPPGMIFGKRDRTFTAGAPPPPPVDPEGPQPDIAPPASREPDRFANLIRLAHAPASEQRLALRLRLAAGK